MDNGKGPAKKPRAKESYSETVESEEVTQDGEGLSLSDLRGVQARRLFHFSTADDVVKKPDRNRHIVLTANEPNAIVGSPVRSYHKRICDLNELEYYSAGYDYDGGPEFYRFMTANELTPNDQISVLILDPAKFCIVAQSEDNDGVVVVMQAPANHRLYLQ
jgi:hypothetical protein